MLKVGLCLFFRILFNILHCAMVFTNRKLARAIKEKRTRTTAQRNALRLRLEAADISVQKKRQLIVTLPTEDLLTQLRERSLTALEVLQAFQAKAIEATEATNCVTEFISEAEEWARALDLSAEIRGSLHGLPVSIKDDNPVKGYDSCIGMAKDINTLALEDSGIVINLKKLGAIPFVRTNIPQTMMCFDSSNPVYGTTKNPVLLDRCPGGSSSGEAALIKFGGSVMGIGSDIAGSVRVPAHMCGINSLKPTGNRLTKWGAKDAVPGEVGLACSKGLMTRDVDTLILGFRSFTEAAILDIDPLMPPVQFQDKLFESTHPLRIGYVEYDGFMYPTPGCKRAVTEAREALENQGHELVPFVIPDITEAWDLAFACMFADGGKRLMSLWKGDILDASSWITYLALVTPRWVKSIVSKVMSFKYPEVEAPFRSSNGCSGADLWSVLARRETYTRNFVAKWRSEGLDTLLVPGWCVPAPPFNRMQWLLGTSLSTMLYNLVDFPAGVVPVTTETESDQRALREEYPTSGTCNIMKEATLGAVGAPIGVQIVGLPWRDELVLRVMKELETSLKNRMNGLHY